MLEPRDQEVLGLDVTVDDVVAVAELQGLHELPDQAADRRRLQALRVHLAIHGELSLHKNVLAWGNSLLFRKFFPQLRILVGLLHWRQTIEAAMQCDAMSMSSPKPKRRLARGKTWTIGRRPCVFFHLLDDRPNPTLSALPTPCS